MAFQMSVTCSCGQEKQRDQHAMVVGSIVQRGPYCSSHGPARFNLADQACEEALYDSASLRSFVGFNLGVEPVPDATTMLKFRRLLGQHKLGEQLFAKVGEVLQASGLKVKTGTIVDATIIGATHAEVPLLAFLGLMHRVGLRYRSKPAL
jgi:hypothetical protein